MATKVGLGHQGKIELFADGSGKKCLALRNCAYVRELDTDFIPLGTWTELWVGFRVMAVLSIPLAGHVAFGGTGFWHNELPSFSVGICAGTAGSVAFTEVDANTTHFLGWQSPLLGTSGGVVGPSAVGPKYYAQEVVPIGYKNGTRSKSGAGGSPAISFTYPYVMVYRFLRSGGNITASERIFGRNDADCTQAQMISVMNEASWADVITAATALSWTRQNTGTHTFSDEQATYGNFSHIEIGWWQNEVVLQVNTILAKSI